MADIGQLPPAHRVPPSRPTTGSGQREEAPQRKKPKSDDPRHDQQRQRKPDDQASRIDEYA